MLIPHEEIRRIVHRFLGPELRSRARPVSACDDERFEASLARSRFTDVRVVHAPGRADVVRSADDVVDQYLSMSWAAPPKFGDRLPEFVAAVQVLLAERSPHGRFREWPGDTAVVMARCGA